MISEEKKAVLASFEKGREYYKQRDFPNALTCFEKCLDIDPDDRPSEVFVERCKYLMENPPPEDWDGVYQMLRK